MTGAYYRLKFYIPILLIIVVFLSSCASYKKSTLFNSKFDVLADTAKTLYVANEQPNLNAEYTIKPGDRIVIKNLQDPKLIAESSGGSFIASAEGVSGYLVNKDSSIILPAIGKSNMVGLTKDEARLKIQKVYEQNLLQNPIIDISISNFSVTVLGEFNKQGRIYLDNQDTHLIEFIGIAGGINNVADKQNLKIIRGDISNPEIIYVNLTDINSFNSYKLILKNKDILYLPQKKINHFSEELRLSTNTVQPLILVLNTLFIIYNLTR